MSSYRQRLYQVEVVLEPLVVVCQILEKVGQGNYGLSGV